MSRTLATFSGKFGDIIWSLPTARVLASRDLDSTVDFAIMPAYESLLPLIKRQSYIGEAFALRRWECQHSNFGDQPWQHPTVGGYQQEIPLGYKRYPDFALARFTAWQQKIELPENYAPFIEIDPVGDMDSNLITFGFNRSVLPMKSQFISTLKGRFTTKTFVNVSDCSWLDAAAAIAKSLCYIGDRSALSAVAHGLSKPVVSYEPDPWRSAFGENKEVFGPGIIGAEFPVVTIEDAVLALREIEHGREAFVREEFKAVG